MKSVVQPYDKDLILNIFSAGDIFCFISCGVFFYCIFIKAVLSKNIFMQASYILKQQEVESDEGQDNKPGGY